MLPWLARKAGIPEDDAERLWAEAVVHATTQKGLGGTSEYWKAAVNRLVELIELESQSLRKTTIEHDSVGYPVRRPSAVMVGRNQSLYRNSETTA